METSESQYLEIMRDIKENGEVHDDRTGVGTLSLFGCQMKMDLREGFPLLTTKNMPRRGIFEELMWFLRGDTNVNKLHSTAKHWWTPWADAEGDLGPIYGEALRRYGRHAFDQLRQLYADFQNSPNSRRLIMTTWQADRLYEMRLPPCHGLVIQFKIHGKEGLSMHTYQRSDMSALAA